MAIPIIPFQIPTQFIAAWQSGALQQVGALLKDVDTGRIVAHLQETGAFQQSVTSLASGPIGLGANVLGQGIGLVQNHQMGKQLTAIQSSLGAMQSIQMLTAVSSVVGIGVTVASTAIILSKLKAVDHKLSSLEQSLEKLPAEWRALNLRKTLGDVETQLERLQEVPTRKDAAPVLHKVEEQLHAGFNALHTGVRQVVAEVEIDAELLQTLLAALAISGSAQIKALYQMDETQAALQRAQTQSSKMQTLAIEMPRDRLSQRLIGGAETAQQIAEQASQVRLIMASRPALTQRLITLDISGPAYLNALKEEQEIPLLVLPAD